MAPFLLALMIVFSGSPVVVHAQTAGASISGDTLCGKWNPTITTKDANGNTVTGAIVDRCGLPQIGTMMKSVLKLVIGLGLPLLVVFVVYRFIMAWFALQQGNAGAYKLALKQSGNAIIGFFFVVALFGGLLMVVLKYFGVKDQPLQLLKLFSDAFIPHAYAQTTQLPNFIGANNLYDLILSILRLVMMFFVYPALIVIWVWTGFAFVMAQGAPEALNKAKKWLMWAVVTTLVIFLLQAFLTAAKGTVEKILPGSTTTTTTTTTNTGPAPGTFGASCPNGGQVQTDGTCSGTRSGSYSYGTDCTGKAPGTLCDVPVSGGTRLGTCSNNGNGVFACYIASQGDSCITGSGVYGAIDSSNVCSPGSRPLVPLGGSCRISAECASSRTCTNNICK